MTRLRHRAWFVGVSVLAGAGVASCGGSGPNDPDPPPPPPALTSLQSLSANPATTAGCGTSTVTATLSAAAPAGGATVTLVSGSTSALSVPASILIPANATSGTATVTPVAATAPTPVSITGTLAAGAGLAASTQATTVTLGPPLANFSVSGTARGADACQLRNSGGQVDCTFNGTPSTGASRWTWTWEVGPNSGTVDTNAPTFQPTTGCSLFSNAPVQGTPGNTFLQMIVRLTVRDATNAQSCVTRNANVRVFSGGFCGGF